MEVQWLFDLFTNKGYNSESINYISNLMSFENFVHEVLSCQDTSFIHDVIQPSINDNSISDKLHTEVCGVAESLFLKLHAQICESLINSDILYEDQPGHDHMSLVGFFYTSAIISIGDKPAATYPTFEEAYGHHGIKKWRDTFGGVPILEKISSHIQRHYTENNSF